MVKLAVDTLIQAPRTFDLFQGPVPPAKTLYLELYPPLPVADGTPVWGFGIIGCAKLLGIDALNCQSVQGTSAELLEIAILLENRTGKFSIAEKVAIAKCIKNLDIKDENNLLSRQITGGTGFFQQIQHYFDLPPWLQAMVIDKRLDVKSAKKIMDLPREVCESAAAYGGFSFSQLRLFLAYVREAGTRDRLDKHRLVERVNELLDEDSPMIEARKWRYPLLSQLELEFADIRRQYLGDSGVNLMAPENFEGDKYSVVFSFHSRGELHRKIGSLQKLEQAGDELEKLL
ncbi:MAG: hypothetical protein CMN78_00475 [Spirochaetales bacterium]|nr:hypothetical protein [Spirochaetales bacterium]